MEDSKVPSCGAFWKDFFGCTSFWLQRGQPPFTVCRRLLKWKDTLHTLVEGNSVHSWVWGSEPFCSPVQASDASSASGEHSSSTRESRASHGQDWIGWQGWVQHHGFPFHPVYLPLVSKGGLMVIVVSRHSVGAVPPPVHCYLVDSLFGFDCNSHAPGISW